MGLERMDLLKDMLSDSISKQLSIPRVQALKAALPVAIDLELMLQRELASIPMPEVREKVREPLFGPREDVYKAFI